MSGAFTAADFRGLLAEVIAPADEAVLIYSGIWTFGHRFRIPPRETPALVLGAIEDFLGPGRTLILPAYTYAYNRERRFDARESKPETGILPETFLGREGVRRTRSAISSFLAKGPLAEEMVPVLGRSVWGEGSLLEWMERRNIRIVTLGLPWAHSCGYLHRVEELAQVPYRYYKDFPGRYRDGSGEWRDWSETMYVRPLGIPTFFNWHLVDGIMRERGQVVSGSRPGIRIESCLAGDLIRAGTDLLASDPYALVANVGEVRPWIEGGGLDAEIRALKSQR